MRKLLLFVVALAALAPLTWQSASAQANSNDAMVSAATGNYNNASGLATGHGSLQSYYSNGQTQASQAPRGLSSQYAKQSVFGLTSTDMSPMPSGRFNYGFNKGSLYPYMGVNRGASGAMLPIVSTGSVDLNTCDLPWCYPDGVSNPAQGMGPGNFVDSMAAAQNAAQQAANQSSGNQSQSAAQALNSLSQFFNLP